ncbi:MAG: virulence RhuM family protein [Proteobacteria bacterium]|nr:virulence RhuM family protein [Pseudomonadota bacterium]
MSDQSNEPQLPNALIYITAKGARIEFRVDATHETMWLTQAQISELFGRDVSVISRHIAAIIEEGELEEESNLQKMQIAGSTKPVTLYNLDMIISVGYRVNSKQGTLFRKWATAALVQLVTKGFVVDADKLKGNVDRLRELREIIRDIRSDEANMYAELRHICAMCQDYDPKSKTCQEFFANFQNRLLYAVTEHTSAELIKARANSKSENMGLTAWKGDRVLKSDTDVAKNYLGRIELQDLNRLVGMVLDFFEDQTERGLLVTMTDAETKLSEILTVNKRVMLKGFGHVTAKKAKDHAHAQYDLYKETLRMKNVTELGEAAKALPKPRRGKNSA